MTVRDDIAFDTFQVLTEFNRSIRHAVLSLEALTRRQGFDDKTVEKLAHSILTAKAATNCYLISVLADSEANVVPQGNPDSVESALPATSTTPAADEKSNARNVMSTRS